MALTTDQRVSLIEFVRQADSFMDLLKGMLAACRPLTIDETTTYLHNCVSDRWYASGRWPSIRTSIASSVIPRFWGAGIPSSGELAYAYLFASWAIPAKSTVGIVRHLDAANVDYRWCTRWVGLEKHVQAGLLRKTQGAWVGQEKSLMARMAESMSNQPDARAQHRCDSTRRKKWMRPGRKIGADIVAYGEFTSTVTVWDTDPGQAEAKLRMVMQAFANQGFTATAERQHATAAWLSSQPGNRRRQCAPQSSAQSSFWRMCAPA